MTTLSKMPVGKDVCNISGLRRMSTDAPESSESAFYFPKMQTFSETVWPLGHLFWRCLRCVFDDFKWAMTVCKWLRCVFDNFGATETFKSKKIVNQRKSQPLKSPSPKSMNIFGIMFMEVHRAAINLVDYSKGITWECVAKIRAEPSHAWCWMIDHLQS